MVLCMFFDISINMYFLQLYSFPITNDTQERFYFNCNKIHKFVNFDDFKSSQQENLINMAANEGLKFWVNLYPKNH
jgi:hypothetical protein